MTPVSASAIDVETRFRFAFGSYVAIFLVGSIPGFAIAVHALVEPERSDMLLSGIWLGLGIGGGSTLVIWFVVWLTHRWRLGTIRVDRSDRRLVRVRGLASLGWRELVVSPGAMIIVEEYPLRVGVGWQTVITPAAQVSVQVGPAPSEEDFRRQSEILRAQAWRRPPAPVDGFEAVGNHIEPPLAHGLAKELAGFLRLEVKRLPESAGE